jgi:hypothetical protein
VRRRRRRSLPLPGEEGPARRRRNAVGAARLRRATPAPRHRRPPAPRRRRRHAGAPGRRPRHLHGAGGRRVRRRAVRHALPRRQPAALPAAHRRLRRGGRGVSARRPARHDGRVHASRRHAARRSDPRARPRRQGAVGVDGAAAGRRAETGDAAAAGRAGRLAGAHLEQADRPRPAFARRAAAADAQQPPRKERRPRPLPVRRHARPALALHRGSGVARLAARRRAAPVRRGGQAARPRRRHGRAAGRAGAAGDKERGPLTRFCGAGRCEATGRGGARPAQPRRRQLRVPPHHRAGDAGFRRGAADHRGQRAARWLRAPDRPRGAPRLCRSD